MSINWDFNKDKMGTWTNRTLTKEGKIYEITYNLYSGNALTIMLEETQNEYYLYSFFADEYHAKNCLGLSKGHNNIFNNHEVSVTLFKENHNTKKLANLLTKANWEYNFTLSIVSKDLPFESESEEKR